MLKAIGISELDNNIFDLISKDWGVITVNAKDKVNGMTVSWVQMGHLWNKDVVTVYVRPQRYTYEFINQEDTFSLAFFDDNYRKELAYLGSASGRNEDKLTHCNFTTSIVDNTPVIDQAKLVFVCRKLYEVDLKEENFVDNDIMNKCYPDKDFHRAYTAEIMSVLVK
ncbi:flavin reductase family protein [Anaerorhabdus sp.]|uniref:flavin reductase family protein n=1 Tax=Anaerorhabdus sp. TaxID=1872524 RepID=UPI002FCC122C